MALELGFARLMALEAELELVESRNRPDAVGAGSRTAENLKAQITALRQALADARERTRKVDTSGDRLVGFVLPARTAGTKAHHNTPR